jgi:hypothetical protein
MVEVAFDAPEAAAGKDRHGRRLGLRAAGKKDAGGGRRKVESFRFHRGLSLNQPTAIRKERAFRFPRKETFA